MFGVDSGELFLIILVAVVVIGPKDLPRVLRTVGHWVGKARGMANQFRSGVDDMMRESEIADLEKKWREQNEAIMRAHPMTPTVSDWGVPAPAPAPAALPESGPVSLGQPDDVVAAPPPIVPAASPQPNGGGQANEGGRRPPAYAPSLVKPAATPARPAAPGSSPS